MANDIDELYREAGIVREAIRVYGGSFMQAIGNAMDRADVYNLMKIRRCWHDEWQKYLVVGKGRENEKN